MSTVAGFNFLVQPALPAAQITESQAAELLADRYGSRGEVTSLGSQQDCNFLVSEQGNPVAVLKIANPAFTETELAAQDAAAELIARTHPDMRVATPLPTRDGEAPQGVRLLPFLAGGTLTERGYLTPPTVAAMGDLAGRVSRALDGFSHPGLDRILQWDLRYGEQVVTRLIAHAPRRREEILAATRQAWSLIAPHADALPRQAVHLDLTDANVVSGPSGLPDGIIDFGDLSDSWAVSELAVTLSSVLGHPGNGPTSILPGVKAFHAVRPLQPAEAKVLWPLLVLRTAVLIVSGAQQGELDPDNAYITDQSDDEWRMFDQATSVPMEVMSALITAELGLSAPAPQVQIENRLISSLDPETVVTLDLSDTLDNEDELAAAAVHDGSELVLTRFGRPRLNRAPLLSQTAPANVETGIGLWPRATTRVLAPWDGEVADRSDDRLTLRGLDFELTLRGVESSAAPGHVRAGEHLGVIGAGRWAGLSVRPAGAVVAPEFTSADLAPGWLALSCDPRAVLGLDALPRDDGRDLLARRDESFAKVQERYYRHPPRIERGHRHYLMSTAGRVYLDMVNNVTVLGHAHPRVADAASAQLRRLNTNSRFNYSAVVEFSERIAATLPDPLDTVFLVNSGSEASDLAIRLATAATGRRDVIAVREAYHGWTYATDAVSTSTADNPNALATRPDWVHTVESPNSFRGKYRGDDAHRYATDAVAQIEAMTAQGRPPAAFICEPVYGNAGGMALPDGYLHQVYAAVRAAGGVAIADEVQVGYGRLGHWFWGFPQQQVVPDIVSVAKATGNGYPLGAVITTRAIADAFRSQGYFFSSTGGSPLSCAIGLTVLDVLRDEGLQDNALHVGEHLKSRLLALRDKHPIVGTVHGMGLYLGVEMIRDPATLEPAGAETMAICERMLELGVIIQPTGEHQNILKTKPPLCIDLAGADFYADTLDRVLTEGW
ncbi:4-aminobutyrate aminotransferase [Mycobacterium adipatum]|uniref:4-aminobutyrate aminotransferase n=1 Tax=Mycobacterium adipatum TaxID=1682113 RepID=A0A172UJX7_9MYCO|nr:aminotransferase [Mycobacterium adipatum]ANE79519.1 4-aminobutyrate aminotransferase [Mycobacterium adipatum]MBI5737816.1 aminotransferase [Mycolicibacterium neoaurum]